jgi:hypothetical protein
MRMMRSGGPPGGEGTTTLIVLLGKPCAWTPTARSEETTDRKKRRAKLIE